MVACEDAQGVGRRRRLHSRCGSSSSCLRGPFIPMTTVHFGHFWRAIDAGTQFVPPSLCLKAVGNVPRAWARPVTVTRRCWFHCSPRNRASDHSRTAAPKLQRTKETDLEFRFKGVARDEIGIGFTSWESHIFEFPVQMAGTRKSQLQPSLWELFRPFTQQCNVPPIVVNKIC